MRPQTKFHIVAISCICIVITAIYALTEQPKPVAPLDTSLKSGRSVEIYSATWGDNCNRDIEQALADRRTIPPAKDEKGQLIELPKLSPIVANNVLSSVSTACNGKPACELPATSEALGVEPIIGCSKKLTVSYRCFSFDRLWTVTVEQSKPLKIDCNDEKSATPASAPAGAPAAK